MRERTKRGLRRLGSGLLALAMVLSLIPAIGVTAQAADQTQPQVVVSDDYQTVEAYANKLYVDGTGSQPVPIYVKSTPTQTLYMGSYPTGKEYKARTYYVYGLEVTLASEGGSEVATVGPCYLVKGYRFDREPYENGFAVLFGPTPDDMHDYFGNVIVINKVPVDDLEIPGLTGTRGNVTYYIFRDQVPNRSFTDHSDGAIDGLREAGDYVDYDFADEEVTYNFVSGANEFTVSAVTGVYNFAQNNKIAECGVRDEISGAEATGKSKTITIYAPYTLTLDLNYDGSGTYDAVTYANGCYVFPAAPTRDGYVFAGWNTQANGSGKTYKAGQSDIKYYKESDSDTLTFNSDTTLYAQWRKLTYDGNEPEGAGTATGKPTGTDVNTSGQLVIPSQEPTLAGYTFLGWNDQADGNGTWYKYAETPKANAKGTLSDPKGTMEMPTDENTTLYAQWLAKDAYIVILKDAYTSDYEKRIDVTGSSYTLPTATEAELQEFVRFNNNSYFNFKGWTDSVGTNTIAAGTPVTLSQGVTVFTAVREACYRVTFDQNLPDSQNLLEGYGDWPDDKYVEINSVSNPVTLPDTRFHTQDYVISGWSTSKSGGTSYGLGADNAYVYADTTFYAQWTKAGRIVGIQGCSGVEEGDVITPTIRLYLPDGVRDNNTTLTVTYGDETDTVTVVENIPYHNFTSLVGVDGTYYYTTNKAISASIGKEVTVTLNGASGLVMDTKTVAISDAGSGTPAAPGVNQYTVTYQPGTCEGTAVAAQSMPGQETVTEGKTYTVNGSTPTATGYTFKGWDSDGDGTANYQPGDKIDSITVDLTLTAVWEKTAAAGQKLVTSSPGSGVTDAQNIPDNIYVTEGEAFTLSNACPTRPGYTFQGWSDGKGNTYQPGAGFADGITTDLTLTAVWQQIGTVDITYSAGASVTDAVNIPSNTTAEENSSYTIPSVVPTRKGYTFTGWSAAARPTSPATPSPWGRITSPSPPCGARTR